MGSFAKCIRLYLRAQSTLLHGMGVPGFKAYGYYVPHRYASEDRPLDEKEAVGWLGEIMDRQAPTFLEHLEFACQFNQRFESFRIADSADANTPRFDQTWFPGLDGAMAYAMVRKYHPQRIIEVGSGHSTRFMAQAIRDGSLTTELHSIDPRPRRSIDALCSRISRRNVILMPVEAFTELERNDFLFIDSSHVAMPGSDVDFLFTRVLPLLRLGVIIHLHDIFLPNGYPPRFPWRNYNEQQALLTLLGGGDRYEILCPNAYLRYYRQEAAERLCAPLSPAAVEGSFWMRVRP